MSAEHRQGTARPKASAPSRRFLSSGAAGRRSRRTAGRGPLAAARAVLCRAAGEFWSNALTDQAAALTYYAVLALVPSLLIITAMLSLLGHGLSDQVTRLATQLAAGPGRDLLRESAGRLRQPTGTGGLLAVAGLLGALWPASGYVAAFTRAANTVFGVPESRPFWRTAPLRLGVTLLLLALLVAGTLVIVLSGPLAEAAGSAIGVGGATVRVWSVVKWPALLLLAVVAIAVLYWAAPNLPDRRFRWISAGSVVAVLLWLAASAGLACYLSYGNSFDHLYGALATVVSFLLWLWLGNIALLLGLEVDAELERRA